MPEYGECCRSCSSPHAQPDVLSFATAEGQLHVELIGGTEITDLDAGAGGPGALNSLRAAEAADIHRWI